MTDEIKKDDQVMVKTKVRSGNLIRYGSVLKIDGAGDDAMARVHFPIDHTQAVIPVSQLVKTSTRYGTSGYVRVQSDPGRRSFTQLRNK
jgi:hypothetical protein